MDSNAVYFSVESPRKFHNVIKYNLCGRLSCDGLVSIVFIESPAEMNPEEQSKFIAGTQWDSNAVYFSAESPRKFLNVIKYSMCGRLSLNFCAGTQWDSRLSLNFCAGTQWERNAVYISAESPRKFHNVIKYSMCGRLSLNFCLGDSA